MPTYRVMVTRKRVVREVGYSEIEAKSEEAALIEAANMEDPDYMEAHDSYLQNWHCEILEQIKD